MEVDRRRFSSESEYKNAIKDAEKIDKIRRQYDLKKYEDVDKLYSQMMSGSISFLTSIGDDFDNEIYELRQTLSLKKDIKEKKSSVKKSISKKSAGYSKKNESHKLSLCLEQHSKTSPIPHFSLISIGSPSGSYMYAKRPWVSVLHSPSIFPQKFLCRFCRCCFCSACSTTRTPRAE